MYDMKSMGMSKKAKAKKTGKSKMTMKKMGKKK